MNIFYYRNGIGKSASHYLRFSKTQSNRGRCYAYVMGFESDGLGYKHSSVTHEFWDIC